jgi:hypothetical protein
MKLTILIVAASTIFAAPREFNRRLTGVLGQSEPGNNILPLDPKMIMGILGSRTTNRS